MQPETKVPPIDNLITMACKQLAAGRCVAIPTETVYGLAADATNGEAVASIFEVKGRPKFNPLICHVDGLEMAMKIGDFDPISRKLAEKFWPGPLTIVVPLIPEYGIHPLVSAGLSTVGIRCPLGLSRDVVAAFGKALAAPSANRSGRISPTRAEHVEAEFEGSGLLVLDGGVCEVGLESTIVKVAGEHLFVLRPGSITDSMLEEATGIVPEAPAGDEIEAPGMMKSHYAPNAKMLTNCLDGPAEAGWLLFGKHKAPANSICRNLSEAGDLREAAANLYSFLKEIDETGVKVICVSPIPQEGLGTAINDRLQRAAAPRGDE